MTITIRRVELSDYEAIHKIFSGPKAVWGTLQVPFPSVEMWRQRLAEPPEGMPMPGGIPIPGGIPPAGGIFPPGGIPPMGGIFPPGGIPMPGGMPGGDFGGPQPQASGTRTANATPRAPGAGMNRVPSMLVETLIQYLKKVSTGS